MCSNKLREKQYFKDIFIKKQYKILQKNNTWHLWQCSLQAKHIKCVLRVQAIRILWLLMKKKSLSRNPRLGYNST